VGYGHVYQGRYKSLLVESDRYFLTLVCYVERNARRAGPVQKAEDWPWSSVYVRRQGTERLTPFVILKGAVTTDLLLFAFLQ
jgi:putative transposase